MFINSCICIYILSLITKKRTVFSTSITNAKKTINYFLPLGSLRNKKLVFTLFLIFITSNVFSQQDKYIDSLQHAFNNTRVTKQRISILNAIAISYSHNKTDSVLLYAKKIEKTAQSCNYKKGKNLANINYGRYYFLTYQYEKAIPYFDKVIEGFTATEDQETALEANIHLADCYFYLNDNLNAIGHLKRGIEIGYKLKAYDKICTILSKMSSIYDRFNDNEQVIRVFNQIEALEICEPSVSVYHTVALSHLRLKDTDNAIKYANKARALIIEKKDSLSLVDSYLLSGRIYYHLNFQELAIENLNKSIALQKKDCNRPIVSLIKSYNLKTYIYLKQSKLDSALTNAIESYNVSKAHLNKIYLTESYKLLSDVYIKLGVTKEGLRYGDLALKHNDSLNKKMRINESYTQLIKLEEQLTLGQKKMTLELNQKQRIDKLLYLLTIALLIGALIFFYNNTRLRKAMIEVKFNLERQQIIKKKMNAIEYSIASDLHDNFGNRFSSLITSIDIIKDRIKDKDETIDAGFIKNLLEIDNTLVSLVNNIKDLLWSKNQDNNTVVKLLERINTIFNRVSCHELSENSSFCYTYDENLVISEVTSKQILLVFRELLHKSHLESGYLKAEFNLQQRGIEIVIKINTNSCKQNSFCQTVFLEKIKKRMQSIKFKTSFYEDENQVCQIDFKGLI